MAYLIENNRFAFNDSLGNQVVEHNKVVMIFCLTAVQQQTEANFGDAFFQGGIRTTLVPDLLEIDITYGEDFRRQETAPGFNIGLAFSPDTLW